MSVSGGGAVVVVVGTCACLLLLCAPAAVTGGTANILVFVPMPVKSHFRGFQPLFEELARRGHNVTVVSSYPLDSPVANYTDVGPFVTKTRGSPVRLDLRFFFFKSFSFPPPP